MNNIKLKYIKQVHLGYILGASQVLIGGGLGLIIGIIGLWAIMFITEDNKED